MWILPYHQRSVVAGNVVAPASPNVPGPRRTAPNGHNFISVCSSMEKLLKRFVKEDSGQDLIEYGLLIGIITSAVVGSISAIGGKVQTYYSTLQSNIGA